jgi:hypothetical protein
MFPPGVRGGLPPTKRGVLARGAPFLLTGRGGTHLTGSSRGTALLPPGASRGARVAGRRRIAYSSPAAMRQHRAGFPQIGR